ncbi:hypothetical protein SDC9_118338 [bioreactor metagenome]|uniref:Uncharacterized protein n=1 Tax=bioreactor metagenome TaxID=1076179 RepID=A0A645C7N9_9ZZZZ
MVCADEVRDLPGILEVDGVLIHADGKGADFFAKDHGADGAHQRGIQSAGEEKTQGGVRVQPLIHGGDQLVADVAAGGLQIVPSIGFHACEVGIPDELSIGIVAARREGADLGAQPDQILRLAGEDNRAGGVIPVEQGADADGVPGGNQRVGCAVVDNQGKLRVQPRKHGQPVFMEHGKQNFAVAAALKRIPLRQLFADGAKAVDFAVAHRLIPLKLKGLHPRLVQAHDGQAVKAEIAGLRLGNAAHVRAPVHGAVKVRFHLFLRQCFA